MVTLLILVHLLVCMLLVVAVLLQQGQGSDLSSVFGGGGGAGSQIMSGRAALSLLNKITIAGFIIFIITSLAISIVQRRAAEHQQAPQEIPVPTQPGTPTTPPASPPPASQP